MLNLEITQKQHEIIEGLLISDGYLSQRTRVACNLAIGQRIDKEEFVDYLAGQLELKYSKYFIKPKPHWKAKVVNEEVRYSSRSYGFLKKYLERWYEGEKIIPSDFKITPITLLYWYIGDGNIHASGTVRLSTCCFPKKDIDRLISDFEGIGMHSYMSRRNEIYFMVQSAQRFFDFIGICPVRCYDYKWPQLQNGHRMSIENKDSIIKLYRETAHTTHSLSSLYGYSQVAVARMLRFSLKAEEYDILKKKKMMSRGKSM